MRKRKSNVEAVEIPRPTIWDVAKRSGVSTATVSRVLNGQSYVSAETRDRVLEVVRELSYVSNRHSLVQQVNSSPNLIGLTSFMMRGDEYTEIIAGITEALHAHNARPVICPIARRHNCGMTLLERLMSKTTDGGLIIGSSDTAADLLAAHGSGFPFVIIDPFMPVIEQIPAVAMADWHCAKTATEHLLSLGHRRIAIVTHVDGIFHSVDRLAGFQSALLAADIRLPPGYIYEATAHPKLAGYQAAYYFWSLPDSPTAILAVNDAIAVGVLRAAHERGYVVPDDLSVMGFDDLDLARMAVPELSTMHLPYPEMGRVGVDMLYRLIEGRPLDATRVELTARLVVRETTSSPRSERQAGATA